MSDWSEKFKRREGFNEQAATRIVRTFTLRWQILRPLTLSGSTVNTGHAAIHRLGISSGIATICCLPRLSEAVVEESWRRSSMKPPCAGAGTGLLLHQGNPRRPTGLPVSAAVQRRIGHASPTGKAMVSPTSCRSISATSTSERTRLGTALEMHRSEARRQPSSKRCTC